MLYDCGRFKIFGDGGNRLIFVTENGQGAWIFDNPILTSMSINCSTIECDSLLGDGTKEYVRGPIDSDLTFKAGKPEHIIGKDLDKFYDPGVQKSVLDLMKIVNKKLKGRVK